LKKSAQGSKLKKNIDKTSRKGKLKNQKMQKAKRFSLQTQCFFAILISNETDFSLHKKRNSVFCRFFVRSYKRIFRSPRCSLRILHRLEHNLHSFQSYGCRCLIAKMRAF
jgi:hypothetical protein